MTPEYAKELIDGIDPRNEYHMWADFPRRYDPHTVYDALEDIARMHHEYAVQVPVNGHWEYTKDDQYGPEVLRNPRDATWYSSRHDAKTWADLWDDGEESPRIVRRLVTDEEVVG